VDQLKFPVRDVDFTDLDWVESALLADPWDTKEFLLL